MTTLHALTAKPPTPRWPTSSVAPHIQRKWPWAIGMWAANLQVAQFLASVPQFSDLPPTTGGLRLFSFLKITSTAGPVPFGQHFIFPLLTLCQFTWWSGGRLPSSVNQQQQPDQQQQHSPRTHRDNKGT